MDASKRKIGQVKHSPNGLEMQKKANKEQISSLSINSGYGKANAIIKVHESSYVGQEPSYLERP